ncbi:hypothetical protein NIES932_28320 [Raphidiopsis curvata NIES-932]|nr:hypothetical protein NIES932_28320 [Raphidiopsis curvata NIES-932]
MKSLLDHLREVKSGGWPVMKRKIKSLYRALLIIDLWAIPFVILARLIRPWYLIRFGNITNERIGHFAADAGSHYARRVLASSRTIDLYWIPKEQSCNDFFDKLVRRNFTTSPLVRSLYRCNLLIPFGAIHHLPSTTSASRDLEGILEKSPSMLPFLPSEDLAAQEWLEKQGWQKGDAFACLSVRDSAYLNNSPLHSGFDWNYHNYRDSDIATYVKAAEWLADQGVWVLRMGKIMKKPIPTAHPRIIDYAFHPEKSDFLDIWLFAHCSLCISTGSGPDMISDIYRCPMLFVNYLPMRNLVSWSDVLHVPKHLMWRSNQQYLTWKEHLENSHYDTEQYDQAGIEINDLSPDEILLAVREAWLTLQGDWVESEGNAVRQARFWEVLRSHPDFNLFHGWIHPRSRAGDYWLNQMGDAFLS